MKRSPVRSGRSVILLLALLLSACAVKAKAPRYRNGVAFGVTSGWIWRPTWWNFYERGVSFARGDFQEDAIEDLLAAIDLRGEDRRRARTYGMHFVDYFPQRELGIIYFRLGEVRQAIERLETSLASEESAKAEYFLNKARKALLEETGADRQPPRILLEWPPEGLLTRSLELQVRGVVTDDQYALGISVNGKSVPVFLARKEIPFSMRVPLDPGPNRLDIVARDLVGKRSVRHMEVRVDRAGPVLFLEPLAAVPGSSDPAVVRVKGEARDPGGLARVSIAGRALALRPGSGYRFDERVRLAGRQASVEIEAEDAAGNVTHGTIEVRRAPVCGPLTSLRLAWDDRALSDLGGVPGLAVAPSPPPGGEAPPQGGGLCIRLKDLAERFTVLYASLHIEGSVTGPATVRSLDVNGEQLLDRSGRHIFFSYLAGLKEGSNTIRITATDVEGNRATKQILVARRRPKIEDLSKRMTLSLVPFRPDGCSRGRAEKVSDDLLTSLVEQRRFQMVDRERLREVMGEIDIARSRLADRKTAVRVGRMLAAEGAIVGVVVETDRNIEVIARVYDSETRAMLVLKDAFCEDRSLEGIRSMMEGLAYKLRQGIPLVEGGILRVEGKKRFYLDVGSQDGLLPSQKVVFFRQGPEIRHPATHLYLGREWKVLGEGRIRELFEDMAEVRPLRRRDARELLATDRIMTK